MPFERGDVERLFQIPERLAKAQTECICCGLAINAKDDFCYGCGFHVCQPCVARHRHIEDDAHMVPGLKALHVLRLRELYEHTRA